MNRCQVNRTVAVAAITASLLLGGCGGGSSGSLPPEPVVIASYGPNAISAWNDAAATVLAAPAATTGTIEERIPTLNVDFATLNVAMYDAVIAIAGTHEPFVTGPDLDGQGASMEAAASAAAYGVLTALFPTKIGLFRGTYDTQLATIPDGTAKSRGLAVGAEAARRVVAMRANDGRDVQLAAYVPGTAPGKFRGTNPINRNVPFIKPFSLTALSQFRAPGPPALDSAAYTADFNETKAFGVANSTVRTAAQTDLARFATEAAVTYWPRNLFQFATHSNRLADNARLMAMLWVSYADGIGGCFDSKYHYEFWRPTSAITLADTDANPDTIADTAWTPIVPTPNHPEYPAAHSCATASMMEALSQFFGTREITFKVDSTVPGTTVRQYKNLDDLVQDMRGARIYGGMHFRTSAEHGAALGTNVAKWVAEHHFKPRNR